MHQRPQSQRPPARAETVPDRTPGGDARRGSVDASPSPSAEALAVVRWALRLAMATTPWATAGLFAIALARAVVPVGIALAAGGLIDAVVASATSGASASLVPWLCVGFVFALLDAVGPLAFRLVASRVADALTHRVTLELLERFGGLDFAELEAPGRRDTMELAQRAADGQAAQLVVHVALALMDVLQIASMALVLVHMQPLVLVIAAPAGLLYAVFRLRSALARRAEDGRRATAGRWAQYVASQMTGARNALETRLLGLGPLFVARYDERSRGVRSAERRAQAKEFLGGATFATLTTVAFYAIFARVAWLAATGALAIGDIAVFLAVSSRLRFTLERGIAEASAGFEMALLVSHLRAFLAAPPAAASGGAAPPGDGALEVEDVSFAYPGEPRPALSGVSLRIAPGEVVAFVGANGAGKTTLVKLIARLYEPDAGRIRLDGVDIREWDAGALHAAVGFLAQEPARFEATAGENIAYGDWRRLADDPEGVRRAARAARADGLVEGLPDGYDTMLGPLFGRFDLSGGQWQTLALARTLARESRLIVLDEPSSNLDASAERDFFRRVRSMAGGRTIVMISHRLTALDLVDRIYVLDAGRVVESGTHAELLERSGPYAALVAAVSSRAADRADRARPSSHAGASESSDG